MNTERNSKIEKILERVKIDNFDTQGCEMAVTPEEVYQSLRDFLLNIPNDYFAQLKPRNIERLPEGQIFITLEDNINKALLGVVLGEDFANFSYTYHWESVVEGETQSVKLLLSNDDFKKAVNLFLLNMNN